MMTVTAPTKCWLGAGGHVRYRFNENQRGQGLLFLKVRSPAEHRNQHLAPSSRNDLMDILAVPWCLWKYR